MQELLFHDGDIREHMTRIAGRLKLEEYRSGMSFAMIQYEPASQHFDRAIVLAINSI